MAFSGVREIANYLPISWGNSSSDSNYNGLNVDDQTQDTTAYYYFENLLDINLSYDNLYIYSQLK